MAEWLSRMSTRFLSVALVVVVFPFPGMSPAAFVVVTKFVVVLPVFKIKFLLSPLPGTTIFVGMLEEEVEAAAEVALLLLLLSFILSLSRTCFSQIGVTMSGLGAFRMGQPAEKCL